MFPRITKLWAVASLLIIGLFIVGCAGSPKAPTRIGEGLTVFICCGDGRVEPGWFLTAANGPDSLDLSNIRIVGRIGSAIPPMLPEMVAAWEAESGLTLETVWVISHGCAQNSGFGGCGGGQVADTLLQPENTIAQSLPELAPWVTQNRLNPSPYAQATDGADIVKFLFPNAEVVGAVLDHAAQWPTIIKYSGANANVDYIVGVSTWNSASAAGFPNGVPSLVLPEGVDYSTGVKQVLALVEENATAAARAMPEAATGQAFANIVIDTTGMPAQFYGPRFYGPDMEFTITVVPGFPGDAIQQLSYAFLHADHIRTHVTLIVPEAELNTTGAGIINALNESPSFQQLISNPDWKGTVRLETVLESGKPEVVSSVLRRGGHAVQAISLAADIDPQAAAVLPTAAPGVVRQTLAEAGVAPWSQTSLPTSGINPALIAMLTSQQMTLAAGPGQSVVLSNVALLPSQTTIPLINAAEAAAASSASRPDFWYYAGTRGVLGTPNPLAVEVWIPKSGQVFGLVLPQETILTAEVLAQYVSMPQLSTGEVALARLSTAGKYLGRAAIVAGAGMIIYELGDTAFQFGNEISLSNATWTAPTWADTQMLASLGLEGSPLFNTYSGPDVLSDWQRLQQRQSTNPGQPCYTRTLDDKARLGVFGEWDVATGVAVCPVDMNPETASFAYINMATQQVVTWQWSQQDDTWHFWPTDDSPVCLSYTATDTGPYGDHYSYDRQICWTGPEKTMNDSPADPLNFQLLGTD